MSTLRDLTIGLPVLLVVLLPILVYWRYRTMRSLPGARRWFLLVGIVGEVSGLEMLAVILIGVGWIHVSDFVVLIGAGIVLIVSMLLISSGSDAAAALRAARKEQRH